LRRELRAFGPGEAFAAALLVSSMYLEPVLGTKPWLASLAITCVAGAALIVWRPENIRRIPLVLVAYVAVYLIAGLASGFGSGSEVSRYLIRPAAIGALALFLATTDSRRRVIVMVVALAMPQFLVTGWQSAAIIVEHGRNGSDSVDGVTGTFGDFSAGIVGLVGLAAACLIGGLAFARLISSRLALGLLVLILAIEVFTGTRANVVFAPAIGVALVAGALLALGPKKVPRRMAVVALAIAFLAAPLTYAATEGLYPGAFTGALSNQRSLVLEGSRVKDAGGGPAQTGANAYERPRSLVLEGSRVKDAGGGPAQTGADAYEGPRGIALLPGRATQIKRAAQISVEDGPRVLLLGRGFGAAAVPENAVVGSVIPKEQTTGATWIGRTLGDTGWLGLTAFFALIGWLAWLGVRIVRHLASRFDQALGFALPAFMGLTLIGAAYTTILDVRAYSAVFIVLAAAGIAAAHGSAASSGNGRRARASTPLPPRQHSTPSAPSATRARSN
jgi:hypothetical protein